MRQRPLQLATRNVLHRVHAQNWGDEAVKVLARYPDEAVRVAKVAEDVRARMADGCDAFFLQEVSGDLLQQLRRVLPASVELHSYRYPRVPEPYPAAVTPRTLWSEVEDPSEHLVIALDTTATGPGEVMFAGHYPDHLGKGYLGVRAGDVTLVNTHLGWGSGHEVQFPVLAEKVRSAPGPVVLAGDFNADQDSVQRGLAALPLRFAPLPAGTATHAEYGHSTRIDHIALLGGCFVDAAVVDDRAGALSDHRSVLASARLGAAVGA